MKLDMLSLYDSESNRLLTPGILITTTLIKDPINITPSDSKTARGRKSVSFLDGLTIVLYNCFILSMFIFLVFYQGFLTILAPRS